MTGSVARLGRLAAGLVAAALVVATCSPTPAADPLDAPPPTFGEVDEAIAALDPGTVLGSLPGGRECRRTGPAGRSGSDEDMRLAQGFLCPAAMGDRTIYFVFADAWEATLEAAGAEISGSGEHLAEPPEAMVKSWTIRADEAGGSSHMVAVTGAGGLTMIVTLDLVVP